MNQSSEIYLITTSIDGGEPDSTKKKIYLGRWCDTFQDDGETNLDKKIYIPYHWNDRLKVNLDFEYLQKINKTLLRYLARNLNLLHSIEEEDDFWNVILGPWINSYTTMLYDRWSCINEVDKLQIHNLKSIWLEQNDESFVVDDTSEFIKLVSESNDFNHYIFKLILEKFTKIKIIKSKKKDNSQITYKKKEKKASGHLCLQWNLKYKRIFIAAFRANLLFSNYLKMRFFQLPLPELVPITAEFNSKLRLWPYSEQEQDNFLKFAIELTPKLLPIIFIEGFVANSAYFRKLRKDNQRCRLILTSYLHLTSDLFRISSAYAIKNGAKLFIHEHGGLALHKNNGSHRYEMEIASKYLTSGWNKGGEHTIAIGNTRIGKADTKSGEKELLIICTSMPKYTFDIRSTALSEQILDWLNNQIIFYEALDEIIKAKTTVRLYPDDYGWDIKKRWLSKFPNTNFGDSKKSLVNLVSNNNIHVCTYNGTTYIDLLTINVPTVIIWNKNECEIDSVIEICFFHFRNVGIFFENSNDAAQHINKVWSDVNKWWLSDEVQTAIVIFRKNISNILNKKKLIDVIKNNE